jgi:hypothetical protein
MIQKYLIKQNTTYISTAARAVVTKQNNSIVGANPSIINEQRREIHSGVNFRLYMRAMTSQINSARAANNTDWLQSKLRRSFNCDRGKQSSRVDGAAFLIPRCALRQHERRASTFSRGEMRIIAEIKKNADAAEQNK